MKVLTYKISVRYAEIEEKYYIQDEEGLAEIKAEDINNLPDVVFSEDESEESINIMAVWLMPFFPKVMSSLNRAEIYENEVPVISVHCLPDNTMIVNCERVLTGDEQAILESLFGDNIYIKEDNHESDYKDVSSRDTNKESDSDMSIEPLSSNDSVQEDGVDFKSWSNSMVLPGAQPESAEVGETSEQDDTDNLEVSAEQEVVSSEQGDINRGSGDLEELPVE